MKTHPHLPCLCLALALAAPGSVAQDSSSAKETPAASQAPAAAQSSGLRFNFRGAPLEQVLNYMSDAAGFVIVLETPVRGTIDMWSTHPVSREEAVQLLNIALNKNGYTATQEGRSLVIASKEDAKKKNIPVRTGNNPDEIPMTAELVTQIIPLRHIDATQAIKDLATVLPSSSTVTANQDSNSLVVTDTQINIRRIVEVASALDRSIESDSVARIFQLKNADPTEMADLLNDLYQTNTSSGSANNRSQNQPFAFGGPGGGGPGGFMAAMQAMQGSRRSGNNSSQSSRSTTQVVSAVADPRTFSVIVSASKSMMPQIAEMVSQLDSNPSRKQKVFIYTLENANVNEVETVLKNLFPNSTSTNSSSSSNQTDILSTRANNNTQATSSSTSSSSSFGSSR